MVVMEHCMPTYDSISKVKDTFINSPAFLTCYPHISRQEPLLVLTEGRHNEDQGQEAKLVTQG